MGIKDSTLGLWLTICDVPATKRILVRDLLDEREVATGASKVGQQGLGQQRKAVDRASAEGRSS
jgi:hypothetical protein